MIEGREAIYPGVKRGLLIEGLYSASCELSVARGCELVFTHGLRVANCQLPVASCQLQVGFPPYQFILYFCSNFRF